MNKLKSRIEDAGGFRHWFANTFWYHYKWPVIAAVVILTVLVYTTVDAIRTPKYDAKIAVIATRNIPDEQLSGVREIFADALGDVNGDGKVNILFRTANLYDAEYAEEYREVFYTCLGDEDYIIYLMDDLTSALYSSETMGYFDDLSELGIESDPDNPCRRSLADLEIMRRYDAEDWYLCMLDRSLESGDEDLAAASERALAMVNALLNSEKAADSAG